MAAGVYVRGQSRACLCFRGQLMTSGRKPTPLHLKLVQGNPGKRPIKVVKRKLQPENAPRMPKGTKPEIASIWRRMVRSAPHGLLRSIDGELLYQWCLSRYLFEEAERKLHASSMLIKTPNGMPAQSPYLAIINRQQEIMRGIAAELGFTPTARARLGVEDGAQAEDQEEGSGYFD